MLGHIEDWRAAPLWTPETIEEATRTWFEYLTRDEEPTTGRRSRRSRSWPRAIGPRPRAKSVIMCHGMFDIVHPGHLRHLMYAKEKADLLVASLTADEHIDEGEPSGRTCRRSCGRRTWPRSRWSTT